MIYAPSISNSYGSDAFASITDAIYNYSENKNDTFSNVLLLIEEIKYQISIVIYSIQSATLMLKDPFDFNRYN